MPPVVALQLGSASPANVPLVAPCTNSISKVEDIDVPPMSRANRDKVQIWQKHINLGQLAILRGHGAF